MLDGRFQASTNAIDKRSQVRWKRKVKQLLPDIIPFLSREDAVKEQATS